MKITQPRSPSHAVSNAPANLDEHTGTEPASATGMENGSSRLSAFRLFRPSNAPPPPPAKDKVYSSSHYNMSTPSLSPSGYKSRSGFLAKFASLSRRPFSPRDGSSVNGARSISGGSGSGRASTGTGESGELIEHAQAPIEPPDFDGDSSISTPWNFQHHVHVDEAFVGLPPSWASALAERGYTQDEIVALHQARRHGGGGLYAPVTSPEDAEVESDADVGILIRPTTRSDSLRNHPPPAGSPGSPTSTSSMSISDSNSRTYTLSNSPSLSVSRPSQARSRNLTPLRVVNNEFDEENDDEGEGEGIGEGLLSPPPAYRPHAGLASVSGSDSGSAGTRGWRVDVKTLPPPPPTRSPPRPPQTPSPPNHSLSLITSSLHNQPENGDERAPPTPLKDYQPLPAIESDSTPGQANDLNPPPFLESSMTSRLLSEKQMRALSMVGTSSNGVTAPNGASGAAKSPPTSPFTNPPTPPPRDPLNDQTRPPAHAHSASAGTSSTASHFSPHPYSATYSEEKYGPSVESRDGGDDDGEWGGMVGADEAFAYQEDDERANDDTQQLAQSSLAETRGAKEAVPGKPSQLELLDSTRASFGLGFGLSIDSSEGWGDSLLSALGEVEAGVLESTEDAEKESKSRARQRELGLSIGFNRQSQRTSTQQNPSTIHEESRVEKRESSKSKITLATSNYSQDQSPLWREVMKLVNPDADVTHTSEYLPDSMEIGTSSSSPPIASPSVSSPSSYPPQPHPPSPLPPQSTRSSIDQIVVPRRLSQLKSPPPFPPPQYPPPMPDTPALPCSPYHLPHLLTHSSRPTSHRTTPESLMFPVQPVYSDTDGDIDADGDMSRDSILSSAIVMAEVVSMSIAKARVQPYQSLPSPLPSTPGNYFSNSPRLLPLPQSPLVSELGETSGSGSPYSESLRPESGFSTKPKVSKPRLGSEAGLRSPSISPSTSGSVAGREVSPSLLSYLREEEDDTTSLMSPRIQLRINGDGLSPETNSARSMRRSSPTILEEWLVDARRKAHSTESSDGAEDNYDYPFSAIASACSDSPLDPNLAGSPLPRTPLITVQDTDPDSPELQDDGEGNQTLRYHLANSGVPPKLKALAPYIRANVDPRTLFADLQEVAEGQYGSVFSAQYIYVEQYAQAAESAPTLVAIKRVPLSEQGMPKIIELERELQVMSTMRHPNILSMDDLYLDLHDDTLWIQMELMERSLADMLALYEDGLVLSEKVIARLAKDSLSAIQHLQQFGIAHRDVRSDNMLLSADGILKVADFAHAILVTKDEPMSTEIVGVRHWQAPEIRTALYDPLKVDVWGIGATVWELVEGAPPFDDIADERFLPSRWSPLTQPELYTRSLHEFLNLCSEPAPSRPDARQLLSSPFIRSACPHRDIANLLIQCRELEES